MSESDIAGKESVGHRVIKLELLVEALHQLAVCKYCKSNLTIDETFVHRKGFVTHIGLKCSNLLCSKSTVFSNPLSNEATSFNKAAILAARLTENGRCTLDTISAWLSIPSLLTPSAYL